AGRNDAGVDEQTLRAQERRGGRVSRRGRAAGLRGGAGPDRGARIFPEDHVPVRGPPPGVEAVVAVTAVGSAFLVGRTYTTGYRTLLAPDFLVDVGALTRLAVPGRDGPHTIEIDGRPLTVVCRTQQ